MACSWISVAMDPVECCRAKLAGPLLEAIQSVTLRLALAPSIGSGPCADAPQGSAGSPRVALMATTTHGNPPGDRRAAAIPAGGCARNVQPCQRYAGRSSQAATPWNPNRRPEYRLGVFEDPDVRPASIDAG